MPVGVCLDTLNQSWSQNSESIAPHSSSFLNAVRHSNVLLRARDGPNESRAFVLIIIDRTKIDLTPFDLGQVLNGLHSFPTFPVLDGLAGAPL